MVMVSHYHGKKRPWVSNMIELSSELLKIIVCPVTKKSLKYDRQAQELISEEAGLAFPIKDGIPILLVDKARKIAKKDFIYNERVVTNENVVSEKVKEIA
jgi:uncharacterized protein YbaR (Trm112 family)